MSKPDQSQLKEKLENIRRRLVADPSKSELQSMQLQLDTLEKWARLANSTDADHQHNHMDDHDNTKFVEPFVVLESKEKTSSR